MEFELEFVTLWKKLCVTIKDYVRIQATLERRLQDRDNGLEEEDGREGLETMMKYQTHARTEIREIVLKLARQFRKDKVVFRSSGCPPQRSYNDFLRGGGRDSVDEVLSKVMNQQGDKIMLNISFLNKTLLVEVTSSSTVELLKGIIEDKLGIPMNRQGLFFNGGQVLDGGRTLEGCDMNHLSNVYVELIFH